MNLLFDLDGTLADPMEAFAGGLDFAFDSLNIPRLSRGQMRTLIGPPLHLALPKLLGEERSSVSAEMMRLYRQHHSKTGIYQYEFYPGMDQSVETLRREHRVFIATSKSKIYADALLKHFGKDHYFESIYGSELSGVNSKKGDVIRLAMSENSLLPHETVMIGDREHDMFGASENGISAVGVSWGYGSIEELTNSSASSVAKDWIHLTEMFD